MEKKNKKSISEIFEEPEEVKRGLKFLWGMYGFFAGFIVALFVALLAVLK